MQSTESSQMTFSPEVKPGLSPERMDALKEVANIGAGHAATALSLMTGARITGPIALVLGVTKLGLPGSGTAIWK